MSQMIYTDEFINDFERLYEFLSENNPIAAQKLAIILEEKSNTNTFQFVCIFLFEY